MDEPDGEPRDRVWEVFRQEAEGDPMIHTGNERAPDEELAVHYARERYGGQEESGRAGALYERLAELPGQDTDASAVGGRRDASRPAALMNHPRADWACTGARRYFYEPADAVRLEALARWSYEPLAQLAA